MQDSGIGNPNLAGGPIGGYDISVYKVKSASDYKLKDSYIWPACFPRDDDQYGTDRGFIAGWLDIPPQILRDPLHLGYESFSYQGVKSVSDLLRSISYPH